MRLTISVILLVAAGLLLYWWDRPLFYDIQDINLEKNAYESALNRMNQLRMTRDSLLTTYNSIPSEDLRRIRNFLPPGINSGLLVVQLSNVTNQNDLVLRSIQILPVDERTREARITFSVSGEYGDFVSFLRDIEDSLRLIDVSSVSFSARGENIYDFNLEAKIYTQ